MIIDLRRQSGLASRRRTHTVSEHGHSYDLTRGTLRKVGPGEYELEVSSNKFKPELSYKSIYTLHKHSDFWYLSYGYDEIYYEDNAVQGEGSEAYSPDSWGTLWTPKQFPRNHFRTLKELVELIDTREDVFL